MVIDHSTKTDKLKLSGNQVDSKTKNIPSWSRPQSRSGSSNLRDRKLVEKCTSSYFNIPECHGELGTSNLLLSSQHLQSLMETCSVTEGFDSEVTCTPSPQPISEETINILSQLEPGLSAKPPLPPSPHIHQAVFQDDIISLKFQQWFPDSILESDIVQETYQKVETDNNKSLYGSEFSINNKEENTFKSSNNYLLISHNKIKNSPDISSKVRSFKRTINSSLVHKSLAIGSIISRQPTSIENIKSYTPNKPTISLDTDLNRHNRTMQQSFLCSNLNDLIIPDSCYVRKLYLDSNIFHCDMKTGLDSFKGTIDRELEKNVTLHNPSSTSGSEMVKLDGNVALPINKCLPVLATNDNKMILNQDTTEKNCITDAGRKEIIERTIIETRKNCEKDYETEVITKLNTNQEECTHINMSKPKDNSFELDQSHSLNSDRNVRNINTLKNEENKISVKEDVMHMENISLTDSEECKKDLTTSKTSNNIGSKTLYNVNKKSYKLKTTIHNKKKECNKDHKPMDDEEKKDSFTSNHTSKALHVQSLLPHLNSEYQKSTPHEAILENSGSESGISSYEDIISMIKVLEGEDLKEDNIKASDTCRGHFGLHVSPSGQSSCAKKIMTFLDEVETGIVPSQSVAGTKLNKSREDSQFSSYLGSLLNTDVGFLARQVMSLTLLLENSTAEIQKLENDNQQCLELLKQHEFEAAKANKCQQAFIDKLIQEKRQLAVEYESAIHELESKNESVIKCNEERHKIEMKKAHDKFIAAEKIKRDKWIDVKTKKIKELTVRGMEPELQHMAATHQEELADLRRLHQRQLTEVEAAWSRRFTVLREQEASERQAAIMHEREKAQYRLEQEINQVEKSYQEQRKRLIDEVRQERDLISQQHEEILVEKKNIIEKEVEEAKKQMQAHLALYEKKHKEEIQKLENITESEKQAWIRKQLASLEAREAALKEQLKHDRDRHIEMAIRRLESEASARDEDVQNKLKRLKESYDAEVNNMDRNLNELKARLKEVRADLQKSEDNNVILSTQLGQAQSQIPPLRQAIEELKKECSETKRLRETEVEKLQKEHLEVQREFQDKINKIYVDKERQLSEIYNRVKITINKKEEALAIVIKQRDEALEQYGNLDKILKNQRKQPFKINHGFKS